MSVGIDNLRIGDFTLDWVGCTLARGDAAPERLQREAVDVLRLLARRPGAVVTRQQIFDEVWPRQSGADNSLNRCITDLCRVLHDDARHPDYIQTVPTRGYRLIAEVATTAPSKEVTAGVSREPPRKADDDARASLASGDFWSRLPVFSTRIGRVALVYIAIGSLIVKATELLSDSKLLPDSVFTAVVLMTLVGFPVTLMLAGLAGVGHADGRQTRQTNASVRLAAVLVAAALIAVGVYRWWPIEDAYLTVLPFDVSGLERDDLQRSLGYAIPRELIPRLQHNPRLNVLSDQASFAFEGTNTPLDVIIERLGTRYVVNGSLIYLNEHLRIRVNLVDAHRGTNIWSDVYDSAQIDSIQLLDQMVTSIMQALGPRVSAALGDPDAPTRSVQAYDHYLRARWLAHDGARSRSGLGDAESEYTAAIEADGRFALAFAGRCEARVSRFAIERDAELARLAEADCAEAAKLSPDSVEVLIAQAQLIHRTRPAEPDLAATAFTEALRRRPGDYDARIGLANARLAQGQVDEARRLWKLAISSQPGNWIGHSNLGVYYLTTAQWAPAIAEFEMVTALTPASSSAFINLGVAHHENGTLEDAEKAYKKAIANDGSSHSAHSNLGVVYLHRQDYAAAAAQFSTARGLGPNDYRVWGNHAIALTGLGEAGADEYRGAIRRANAYLSTVGTDTETLADLATYHAGMGDFDVADARLAEARKASPDSSPVLIAELIVASLAGLDDRKKQALSGLRNHGYDPDRLRWDPRLRITQIVAAD